jgi:hypothetical protein
MPVACFGGAARDRRSSLSACSQPDCCNPFHHACVQAPTASPLLDGRWRLLFTTRPGTASPIQRTFTAVDKFSGGCVVRLGQMLTSLLLPCLHSSRASLESEMGGKAVWHGGWPAELLLVLPACLPPLLPCLQCTRTSSWQTRSRRLGCRRRWTLDPQSASSG